MLVPGLPDGAAKGAAVRNAAVDGFVLHGVVEDDPLVAATVERRLPTVAVDSPTLDGARLHRHRRRARPPRRPSAT